MHPAGGVAPPAKVVFMALPWLRILDTVVGVGDLALSKRARKIRRAEADPPLAAGGGALGLLETHLTGVVVAALKEAFDRDSRRLDLEHEQVERRARCAPNGRCGSSCCVRRATASWRVFVCTAVMAAASWIGTLFFSARLIAGGAGARVALGSGWVVLLGGPGVCRLPVRPASATRSAASTSIAIRLCRRRWPAGSRPWFVVVGLGARRSGGV